MKHHVGRLIAVTITIGLVACADETPPTQPDTDASASVSPEQRAMPWTIDDEYDRIAREEIPGFAGYYLDENQNPVVLLKDPSQRSAAETWAVARTGELGLSTGAVVIKPASYDFTQLKQWRDKVLPTVFNRDDFVSLDIDEVGNRLRIGVDVAVSVSAIETQIADMGIPTPAVLVEVQPRTELRKKLTDRQRPVRAGFQINNEIKGPCRVMIKSCGLR